MKESAITLIKQKGDCSHPVHIACNHCALKPICILNSRTEREKYELIVNTFVEEFGQEALVEALM
jgi:hypothetical protein